MQDSLLKEVVCKPRPYYIGIDPGEHTGLAVWDGVRGEFLTVDTMPLHRAFERVLALKDNPAGRPLRVVFEDARQRKWFERERSASEYRGKLMGAGAAKRDAKIWEEFLTDHGIPFTAHKPQPGGTKWKAEAFARATGYTGRTNEHNRDAALLVYGMR